jgi:CHAT domain-containing protein
VVPPAGAGRVRIVDLGEASRIDAAVAEFRKAMTQTDRLVETAGEAVANQSINKTLRPLAELVWRPLAEHAGDARELVLSPDAALWLVPWAALPIEEDKFLLERFNIRYVTSGRELVRRNAASKSPAPAVVIADPDYDLEPRNISRPAANRAAGQIARRSMTRLGRANRLPGTAREARAIEPALAKLVNSRPALYLDAQATEPQFKELTGPQVLVLSTHGFFLEDQHVVADDDHVDPAGDEGGAPAITQQGSPLENPLLRCGLLLAGANRRDQVAPGTDDGVLTGLEIVGTDLRGTEMVVLSACDTGVGEVRNGEGVAGLRQAFQLAGAGSVVATLWQIPDEETVQLVNDYFGYLADGQTKSEALRSAQLARIADHRERNGAAHPFYWAAFTITGGE